MPDLMEQLASMLTEPASLPCPAPGVYPGTPMLDYHRWSAASNSRLTKLLRSPAHLKSYLDEPDDDTTALTMGRAVHSAILEPDDFAKRYGRSSGADRRTKAGKQEWDDLLTEFGVGYVLKPDDYDAALKMRDSVRSHASASKLLEGDGDVEFSIVFDSVYNEDGDTLRCKARLDRHSSIGDRRVIVDVKTTRDASRRAFEKSIFEHGYHRQGALYLDAARSAGMEALDYVIIAIEKEAPFACAVYRLTEGAIEAGREQLNRLMRDYAMCETLGEWPAYAPEVQDIALPAYAWAQIDEDLKENDA